MKTRAEIRDELAEKHIRQGELYCSTKSFKAGFDAACGEMDQYWHVLEKFEEQSEENAKLKEELKTYQGPRFTSAGSTIRHYQEENTKLKASCAKLVHEIQCHSQDNSSPIDAQRVLDEYYEAWPELCTSIKTDRGDE